MTIVIPLEFTDAEFERLLYLREKMHCATVAEYLERFIVFHGGV